MAEIVLNEEQQHAVREVIRFARGIDCPECGDALEALYGGCEECEDEHDRYERLVRLCPWAVASEDPSHAAR